MSHLLRKSSELCDQPTADIAAIGTADIAAIGVILFR